MSIKENARDLFPNLGPLYLTKSPKGTSRGVAKPKPQDAIELSSIATPQVTRLHRNRFSRAQVAAAAVGAAPVNLERAVVPAGVGNVAIRAARAGAQCPVVLVQVLPGLPEVPQFQEHPLQERDPLDAPLSKLIGRQALELFIGLHAVAKADCVGLLRRPVIPGNDFVPVGIVAPGRPAGEPRLTLLPCAAHSHIHIPQHDDRPAEAARISRNGDVRKVGFDAKHLAVEPGPIADWVGLRNPTL